MRSEFPHYLLFSEASRHECATARWRFVLQRVGSTQRFSASDVELCAESTERLELLAVVRGLEALDGPAQVTLVTRSRYVCRGIKQGIQEWRESGWRWERFGRIVPVRDGDLWQRVARASDIHRVDCQAWQFDTGLDDSTVARTSDEPKTCGRRVWRKTGASRRRVRKPRMSAPKATLGSWVDRWAETLGSISGSKGLSIGSGAVS